MGQLTAWLALALGLMLALLGCDTSPGPGTAAPSDAAAEAEASVAKATTQASTERGVATEKAMFGAGCFWGVESTFRKVPGVLSTAVGYAGGRTQNPTYKEVCEDQTGHAEVVQVEYDPSQVSYQKLLEVFFENHDPTTLNRQGPDRGTQYRSAVFFYGPEQQRAAAAEKARRDASGEYVGPIVTEITTAPAFWAAEDYHQRYFEKQGINWSCHTGNGKKRKVSVR